MTSISIPIPIYQIPTNAARSAGSCVARNQGFSTTASYRAVRSIAAWTLQNPFGIGHGPQRGSGDCATQRSLHCTDDRFSTSKNVTVILDALAVDVQDNEDDEEEVFFSP